MSTESLYIPFVEDDGGRTAAGFKGSTGDCACRAAAVATGYPYKEVYDLLVLIGSRERITKRKREKSHPRTGIYKQAMHKLMVDHYGFEWVACMGIGTGCTVHVRPDELPHGRLVLSLSKHYSTMIDGVIHDTYDPSREGTRCVYGYWIG